MGVALVEKQFTDLMLFGCSLFVQYVYLIRVNKVRRAEEQFAVISVSNVYSTFESLSFKKNDKFLL